MIGFHELVLAYAPWSVSKYGTLDKCGRQFLKKYVEREPEAASGSAARIGTTSHDILDISLRDFTPVDEARYEAACEKEKLTTPERAAVQAHLPYVDRFVKRIQKFEKAKGVITRGLEAELGIAPDFTTIPYSDKKALIRGKIDYLAITEKGAAVVGDHKTGKRKNLEDHLLQLYTYMIFVAALYPQVKTVQCFIHYVGDDDLDWTKPMGRDEIEGRLHPWLVTTLNRHVPRLVEIDAGKPKPSTGWQCDWCGFVAACPEGKAESDRRAAKRAASI